MLINLSTNLITGDVNLDTPKCVILEIIRICKAKIDETKVDTESYRTLICNHINTYENIVDLDIVLNINLDQKTNELEQKYIKRVASFINPNVKWSLHTLKNSLQNILNVLKTNYTLQNCTFGLQTPENTEALNLCVCYKLCKKYNINLNYTTQQNEIYTHVKRISSLKNLKTYICNNLDNYEFLIKIYPQVTNSKLNKEIVSENLNIAYNLFKKTNKKILIRLNNLTVEESIVIAILAYDIDISYCENPIQELINLNIWNADFWNDINFNLIDYKVNKIFKLNKKIFRFSLNFNPIFPSNFYNNLKLISLYESETLKSLNSISDTIISNYYEELQTYMLCNSFYAGFHLNTSIETEIYKSDIFEFKNSEILSYGSKNTQMIVFTFDEINQLFKNNLKFILPNNTLMDDNNIEKLIKICNTDKNESKNLLLETINDLKLFNDAKANIMKDFYNFYKSSNDQMKEKINSIIQNLLILGMRMRGWLDEPEYPIIIAKVENQYLVDVKVQDALIEYEKSLCTLEKNRYIINNFPLMKYNKGFHFSTNMEDGKTLGERIELFKQGETTDNMGSCMRLSSNYVVTTAHKMFTIIGLPEPFDIKLLRNIS